MVKSETQVGVDKTMFYTWNEKNQRKLEFSLGELEP